MRRWFVASLLANLRKAALVEPQEIEKKRALPSAPKQHS
jgi:hypothetical protein